MNTNKEIIIDENKFFGPLLKYIKDDSITDIDYAGKDLWITDCNSKRSIVQTVTLDEEFIEQFTKRVSNMISQPFHKMSPVLEAETDTLRITIVHEDVCQGKRCICIRKSLPKVRLTEENAIKSKYATKEILDFLKQCVKSELNMVFVGNPGAGKTECARFLANYIPSKDRVITIEDTPEWHYSKMNPKKDCVEIKVGKNIDYTKAIKTCMRLNPKWMMLSEARSIEVLSLIEGFSTGVKGITTIHTDDVRNIPDRILNMASQKRDEERLLNDIFTFVDVGILIKKKEMRDESGKFYTRRYINQVGLFSRDNGVNSITLIVDNGNFTGNPIPKSLKEKFKGFKHPTLKEKPFNKQNSEQLSDKNFFKENLELLENEKLEQDKKKVLNTLKEIEDKQKELKEQQKREIEIREYMGEFVREVISENESRKAATYRGKGNLVGRA